MCTLLFPIFFPQTNQSLMCRHSVSSTPSLLAGAVCYSSIAADHPPPTHTHTPSLHPSRCKLINIPPVFTVPSSGGNKPSGLGPVRPRTELHIRTFPLT